MSRSLASASLALALGFGGAIPAASASLPAVQTIQNANFVIRGDSWVGDFRTRFGSLENATAAFGAPARTFGGEFDCTATWPSLGLVMEFFSACSQNPFFQTATTTDSRWRTDRGLRISDPAVKLRRLYPRARWRTRTGPFPGLQFPAGYWLITRTGFSDCAGLRFPLPGLLARMSRGRVAAFVVRDRAIGCE